MSSQLSRRNAVPRQRTEVSRNPAIDWLRAGSILYIVGFWHLLGYADAIDGYKNAVTYRLTVVILGLFVFISGHLIGRSGIRGNKDIFNFYKRRLIRIYPPYVLALLLFYLFGILKPEQLPGAAFLVSSFTLEPPLTLWYISMLVVFYLVAPFLLLLLDRIQRLPLSPASARLILSGLLIAVTVMLGKALQGVDPRMFLYFPPFVVGLMTVEPSSSSGSTHKITISGIGLLGSILFSMHNVARIDSSLYAIPLAIFGPLFLFFVANRMAQNQKPWPVMYLISTASFFMYLFHRPVFETMESGPFPGDAIGQLAYLVLVGLPVIIALSWLGQILYDRAVKSFKPPHPAG